MVADQLFLNWSIADAFKITLLVIFHFINDISDIREVFLEFLKVLTTFGIRVLFTEAATKGVCEKGALRNLAKFTGKHLYQGLFFNKVAGLRPAYLFQKRLCTGAAKVLRKPFLTEHLWWLLLYSENQAWAKFKEKELVKSSNKSFEKS